MQTVGPDTVMVFPWLVGTVLSPGPATSDAARQIGALLGRLHLLTPNVSGLAPPVSPRFSEVHWAELARQAKKNGVTWADAVGEALPELADWSAAARRAREGFGESWVVTHRDMDQKNVLWSDPHMPNLLDWEEAGAMNPALEVMGTALNWAGQAAGPPEAETFASFLNGYQSHAPLDRAALRHAAMAVLDKRLVWPDFNLVRSLPDADTPRRLLWCEAVTAFRRKSRVRSCR